MPHRSPSPGEASRSPTVLAIVGLRPGERHLVDDSYETGYKVESAWFTGFAVPANGKPLPGTGMFTLESFARPAGSAERSDRRRAAQRPIGTTRVEIRT
ncbi:hypothetical protein PV367_03040 [Streptomyces europaeiscabiei]|uniref:Uncharacterized protein n=1 Tax=Streptomyces europaeiscabiei TaxID=146819 RepID=A0AAJ2PKP8_9ACTN|nr:hypothetical protein [Streptomyces europaeiscabiei]MDX3128796.1 hypothetical protein [Streptomyces europaeiscabiei]